MNCPYMIRPYMPVHDPPIHDPPVQGPNGCSPVQRHRKDENTADYGEIETIGKSWTRTNEIRIEKTITVPAENPGIGDQMASQRNGVEPVPGTGRKFSELEPGSNSLFPDQTAIDAVSDPNPNAVEQTLAPIIDLIRQGHSYQEVEERLFAQYPDMKTNEIERLMERSIFVSEVWGRLNA